MTETQLPGELVSNREILPKYKTVELKLHRLKQKIPAKHKAIAELWDQALVKGASCYGRPIGPNTRRIYFNGANKFWRYLKEDYSNLYQSVVMAIDSCPAQAYSTRKHIKEAGVSLAKYLIYQGGLING